VPIVMLAADPVGDGLVASLARPGGNVTGTDTLPSPEFSQKWLEFLKDAAPRASRVAGAHGAARAQSQARRAADG
jgi:putative ABC transport system substrate-binding protein